jgi:hypothetical protein
VLVAEDPTTTAVRAARVHHLTTDEGMLGRLCADTDEEVRHPATMPDGFTPPPHNDPELCERAATHPRVPSRYPRRGLPCRGAHDLQSVADADPTTTARTRDSVAEFGPAEHVRSEFGTAADRDCLANDAER